MWLIDLLHYNTNPREKNQGPEKASGLPLFQEFISEFVWWSHHITAVRKLNRHVIVFCSFPWVLTAATEVLKVVLWKAGVKASFSAVPCPAGRLHSRNSAWDNERVVNYSYGNPHGFCYRSCYCTQAAQDKMGLSFSQKERQSSDSHSQNQSCSTSEYFPCASSSYVD